MVVQVIVYDYNNAKMAVDLCSSEKEMETLNVLHLKQKIAEKMNPTSSNIVVDKQLIFGDKRLDNNDATLSSCKLMHQSVIQMVMTMDGGQTT